MRLAPILLTLLSCASVARAVCPTNIAEVNRMFGCPIQTSTAPTFSYSSFCFTGSGTLTYNLPQGTIFASAQGAGDTGIENYVQTSDDFVLNGPAGGGSVTITAILDCVLQSGTLNLYSGASRDSTSGSGRTRLRIVMQHSVGDHFLIGMLADVFSGSLYGYGPYTSAQGTLGFTALPAGYSLSSCQGYAGAVVPTRRVSWGAVKTYYR